MCLVEVVHEAPNGLNRPGKRLPMMCFPARDTFLVYPWQYVASCILLIGENRSKLGEAQGDSSGRGQ